MSAFARANSYNLNQGTTKDESFKGKQEKLKSGDAEALATAFD